MTDSAIVILGAGSGSRVGAEVNKVLLPFDGLPMVAWSVRDALAVPGVGRVLVVVRDGEMDAVDMALSGAGVDDARVACVVGGSTRHESEWRALQHLAPAVDAGEVAVVAIHDAARPRAGTSLFAATIDAARQYGGALPVVTLSDVVARDGRVLPRHLAGVQTPQSFRARALLDAYRAAERDGFTGTDTAACFERYADPGLRIAAVPGSRGNLKVTFPEDLAEPRPT